MLHNALKLIVYFLIITVIVTIFGYKMMPDLIVIFDNRSEIHSGVKHNTETAVAAEPEQDMPITNEHETSKDDIVDANPTEISKAPLPAVPSFFPSLPSGWSWLYLKEIATGVPIPDNWHWNKLDTSEVPILMFPRTRPRVVQEPIVTAFIITKEPFDSYSSFKTGLTLIVMQDMYPRMGVSPHDYAKAYIRSAHDKGQVEQTWERSLGPFYERGCLARYFLSYGEPTTTHHSLLVNPENGTIYLVIFKGQTSEWEQAWKTGYTMVYSSMYNKAI